MRSGFATGIQVISNSSEDVDFYIHELYPIHFFGTTVYITTTHVCTFIVLLVIAILAICARRSVLKTRDNPSKYGTRKRNEREGAVRYDRAHQRGDHPQHLFPRDRHHANPSIGQDRPQNRRYRRSDARSEG